MWRAGQLGASVARTAAAAAAAAATAVVKVIVVNGGFSIVVACTWPVVRLVVRRRASRNHPKRV
jgi:hypothetical protein